MTYADLVLMLVAAAGLSVLLSLGCAGIALVSGKTTLRTSMLSAQSSVVSLRVQRIGSHGALLLSFEYRKMSRMTGGTSLDHLVLNRPMKHKSGWPGLSASRRPGSVPAPLMALFCANQGRGYTTIRKSAGWIKSTVFSKSFRLSSQIDSLGHPEFLLDVR